MLIICFINPAYNKQDKESKLLIAVFAPLTAVFLKAFSRLCVQRLYNITHPGYSYVLLTPLYGAAAVMFRILQADPGNLQSIATLGIIHGVAEVIERSTMVVIDHLLNRLWKLRTPATWGCFRTPRRESLMADIALMSMLFESAAIVSVNGVIYLYRFTYIENNSFLKLLRSFAITIETRYQNRAVMAVWIRQWRRHILVAIVNTLAIALCISTNILDAVNENELSVARVNLDQTCKIPF